MSATDQLASVVRRLPLTQIVTCSKEQVTFRSKDFLVLLEDGRKALAELEKEGING